VDADDVMTDNLGSQLTGKGSMLDDVHADPKQLSHFFRGIPLLLQEFVHRVVGSVFHRVSSSDESGNYHAVQPPST
jgi:hypothetical protein